MSLTRLGQSWEAAKDFLAFDTDQQVYMATVLLADKRTLRVAVSGHPKEYEQKPLHDVWACTVDLQTGAVSHPSDGAVIANLHTGENLPLDYRDLERVHATPATRTVNLFDVGAHGRSSRSASFRRSRTMLRRAMRAITSPRSAAAPGRPRTSWLPARSSATFDAGFYVGGLAFPDRSPGGRVYLTREADGLWYLERWERDAAGIWVPRLLLPASATRLTRPWAVTNPGDGLEVVVLALERYGEEYFGWLSHLVAAGSIARGGGRR